MSDIAKHSPELAQLVVDVGAVSLLVKAIKYGIFRWEFGTSKGCESARTGRRFWAPNPLLFFFFFEKVNLGRKRMDIWELLNFQPCDATRVLFRFQGLVGWLPLAVLKLVGTSRYAVNKDKNIERSSHKTRFEGHHAGLVAFWQGENDVLFQLSLCGPTDT